MIGWCDTMSDFHERLLTSWYSFYNFLKIYSYNFCAMKLKLVLIYYYIFKKKVMYTKKVTYIKYPCKILHTIL